MAKLQEGAAAAGRRPHASSTACGAARRCRASPTSITSARASWRRERHRSASARCAAACVMTVPASSVLAVAARCSIGRAIRARSTDYVPRQRNIAPPRSLERASRRRWAASRTPWRRGETLGMVAQQYGVTVGGNQGVEPSQGELVRRGTRLKIRTLRRLADAARRGWARPPPRPIRVRRRRRRVAHRCDGCGPRPSRPTCRNPRRPRRRGEDGRRPRGDTLALASRHGVTIGRRSSARTAMTSSQVRAGTAA